MIGLNYLTLAVAFPDLTVLYWICMIVGGSLLAFSMLGAFGGHADADFDVDAAGGLDVEADVEVDVDVDAGEIDVDVAAGADAHFDSGYTDAASLTAWLSIRFVVYFTAVFGVLGVVLTYLSDNSPTTTAGVAALGGLLVGQGVHQLFRKLKRSSSNSATTDADYTDKIGRVSATITHPRKGEIAISVRSRERFVPAVAKHPDTTFSVGDEVGVVAYRGGVAEVVSRKEFEFLTHKK
ncbi:MAG: hypothetical protein IH987_09345 [Planctomycetes bacterium]|nr:hypothetical protein [Planctomycetota bacterium]